LNNSFYANCIDLLLFHLHELNLISCLFEPYNLIGFGNGANISLYFALLVNDTNDNLRSLLLFNGFSYIDAMLKETMQMVIDSYKKCPDNLSEYGDFFF
jgi:predicted esterase